MITVSTSEEARDDAKMIRGGAVSLLETMSQILDFSRLESDIIELDIVEVDVRKIVEAAVRDVGSFAENKGLHCRAIKADLSTISSLNKCQIVLYMPGKQHFVVLTSIDNDFVRIIDLASRKFCYRTATDFFPMDWSTGVALVLSQNAIAGDLNDISSQEMADISGAAGWTCTYLLQDFSVVNCQYAAGECLGDYTVYWERWGCESASSGSCSSTSLWRLSTAFCIEDPDPGIDCTTDGDWTHYWMTACM